MIRLKKTMLFLSVVFFISILSIGCKSGGLFQMNEDNNKALDFVTFKGVSTQLTAGFPIAVSDSGKDYPISDATDDTIKKAQRFQGNSNGLNVTVTFVNYRKDLFDNITDADRKNALREAVKADLKMLQQQKDIHNLKSNQEEITIDRNPAIVVTTTCQYRKDSMEGKLIYTIKKMKHGL